MNWKFTGDRPVYQQIMAAIRGSILKEELSPGSKVPSVRDLAAEAQVNPNTMQRALTELERDRLVVSHGTMGRFVTGDHTVLDGLRQQAVRRTVQQCSELLAQVGLTLEEAAQLLKKDEV